MNAIVFPGTRDDERWPGSWAYGVDFSGGSDLVVAVNVGGNDDKYGLQWTGPIDLRKRGSARRLEAWAARVLDYGGGYVHLFPAARQVPRTRTSSALSRSRPPLGRLSRAERFGDVVVRP